MRKLILIITSFLAVMAMCVFAQELPGNDMYHSEWHGKSFPVTFYGMDEALKSYAYRYDSIRKYPLLQLNPDHGIDNLQTVLNSLTPMKGHSGYRVPDTYELFVAEISDTVYMFLSGYMPFYLLSKKGHGVRVGEAIAGIYVNKIGGDSAFFVIKVLTENRKKQKIRSQIAYTADYKTDSLRTARIFKSSSDSVSAVRDLRLYTGTVRQHDEMTCFIGKLLPDSITGMLHFAPVFIRIPEQRLHEFRDSLWKTPNGHALMRKRVCNFDAIR